MKAQIWIFLLLLGALWINISANGIAQQELKQKHVIQAIQLVSPHMLLYAVVGLIALELLSDVSPEFAVGIAALLLVGSALQHGQTIILAIQGKTS